MVYILKLERGFCNAATKCVSLLVLTFKQGAAPANNSTTLYVTIVGVNSIFNCGHVEKRPLVGVESKHLKMLLDSNVFTGELMTSTEEKKLTLFLKKITKFVFKFLNSKSTSLIFRKNQIS